MKITPESLARASSRRPWRVIVTWLVAIVIAVGVSATLLDGVLTTEAQFTNKPEAKRALDRIEDEFGEEGVREIFIVRSEDATVEDPEFEAHVGGIVSSLQDESNDIKSVLTFFDTGEESMVSEDGSTTLVQVAFENTGHSGDHLPAVEAARGFDKYDAIGATGATASQIGRAHV